MSKLFSTLTIKDGQPFTGEPIDAGDYTASVTVGDATASVEYTIRKNPVSITADNKTKELQQDDPELTATCAGLSTLHFENNSTYPWILVTEGDRVYAQSGNKGVAISTSSLTLHVALNTAGTVSFDYEAWGEGSSTAYDACIFKIDGNEKFRFGSKKNSWETVSYDLSAGAHTLVWSYSKDESMNPIGDYFLVDNIVVTNALPQPGTITELDRAVAGDGMDIGGVVEGETLNYTISREAGEALGEYAIIVTPGENPNYEVTAINGVFTIVAPPVSCVALTPDTPQMIDEGGVVVLTASVEPDLALDKTVIWTVDSSNVKLYSDENCTAANMIGTNATDIMTVYAKGLWAGDATVTVTSNEDNTKSASCVITVNKVDLPEIIEDCTYQLPESPVFANVPFAERDPIEVVYGAMIIEFGPGIYYAIDARQYQYKFYDRAGNEIPAEIALTNTMPGSNFGLSDDVTLYVTGYSTEAFENADAVYVIASCAVTWKDGDDVLETDDVPVGNTPKFNGETPTKPSDDTYDYSFAGWTDGIKTYAPNELPAVTEPTTYTAVFTATERYEAVEALINELSAKNDVTTADEAQINAARDAYDALTDEQKAKIDNETLAKLTNAEAGIDDAEAAAAVEDMINDLGDIELTDECAQKLEEARNAYNNLTDDQKARVKNAVVLDFAEKAFDALEAKESADQAAAAAQAAQQAAEEAQEAAEAAQAAAEAAQQAAEDAQAVAEAAQADAEERAQAAEDAQAAAEAAQQAAEDAQKTAEDKAKAAKAEAEAAKEAQKTAEDAQKTAEEIAKAAGEDSAAAKAAKEAADEAAKAAEDKAKAAKEAKESADEAAKTAEDKAKAAEEAKEAANEAAKTAEDKAKAAEEAKESADEAAKAAEDKAKAAEEAKKAAEDKAKAAEEAKKEAEDRAKAAEEATKAAVEKAVQETTDKLTAQGVAYLINALPAADKITADDKSAVENARKAYDALTDDQKALIDADTLKKLTEAEAALAALDDDNSPLGDVNGDGVVDSADALMLLRASVGLDDLNDEKNLVGDVNGDGTVDSADALDVLRYSVQLSANENIGKPVTKAA